MSRRADHPATAGARSRVVSLQAPQKMITWWHAGRPARPQPAEAVTQRHAGQLTARQPADYVRLRVPPAEAEIERLFAGWREELATRRKFVPAARNYAAARLEADVGLRVNEIRMLDLDDVRWELGRFGKLNVRHGKGARRRGPKPRLVRLINGA